MPEPLGVNVFGDHAKLGREVAKWAKDRTSWPAGGELPVLGGIGVVVVANVDTLKEYLKNTGMVSLPDRIKTVVFMQPDNSTYIVRLPPKDLVEQSEAQMQIPGEEYELPDFYKEKIAPDEGVAITDIDLLYSRIGDYTFAHCM